MVCDFVAIEAVQVRMGFVVRRKDRGIDEAQIHIFLAIQVLLPSFPILLAAP